MPKRYRRNRATKSIPQSSPQEPPLSPQQFISRKLGVPVSTNDPFFAAPNTTPSNASPANAIQLISPAIKSLEQFSQSALDFIGGSSYAITNPYNETQLFGAYMSSVYMYAALRRVMSLISRVRIVAEIETGNGYVRAPETTLINQIFERDGSDLLSKMWLNYAIYGTTAVYKTKTMKAIYSLQTNNPIYDYKDGAVAGLTIIDTPKYTIQEGSRNEIVGMYVNNQTSPDEILNNSNMLTRKEFIYVTDWNPYDRNRGKSIVAVAMHEAVTNTAIASWAADYFTRGAMPFILVNLEEDPALLTDADLAKYKRQFQEYWQGKDSSLRAVVTDRKITTQQVGIAAGEVAAPELNETALEGISAAVGLDRELIVTPSGGSQARHAELIQRAWNDTVIPTAQAFLSAISRDIGLPHNMRLVLDLSHITELEADRADKSGTEMNIFEGGLQTFNETRTRMNMKPVEALRDMFKLDGQLVTVEQLRKLQELPPRQVIDVVSQLWGDDLMTKHQALKTLGVPIPPQAKDGYRSELERYRDDMNQWYQDGMITKGDYLRRMGLPIPHGMVDGFIQEIDTELQERANQRTNIMDLWSNNLLKRSDVQRLLGVPINEDGIDGYTSEVDTISSEYYRVVAEKMVEELNSEEAEGAEDDSMGGMDDMGGMGDDSDMGGFDDSGFGSDIGSPEEDPAMDMGMDDMSDDTMIEPEGAEPEEFEETPQEELPEPAPVEMDLPAIELVEPPLFDAIPLAPVPEIIPQPDLDAELPDTTPDLEVIAQRQEIEAQELENMVIPKSVYRTNISGVQWKEGGQVNRIKYYNYPYSKSPDGKIKISNNLLGNKADISDIISGKFAVKVDEPTATSDDVAAPPAPEAPSEPDILEVDTTDMPELPPDPTDEEISGEIVGDVTETDNPDDALGIGDDEFSDMDMPEESEDVQPAAVEIQDPDEAPQSGDTSGGETAAELLSGILNVPIEENPDSVSPSDNPMFEPEDFEGDAQPETLPDAPVSQPEVPTDNSELGAYVESGMNEGEIVPIIDAPTPDAEIGSTNLYFSVDLSLNPDLVQVSTRLASVLPFLEFAEPADYHITIGLYDMNGETLTTMGIIGDEANRVSELMPDEIIVPTGITISSPIVLGDEDYALAAMVSTPWVIELNAKIFDIISESGKASEYTLPQMYTPHITLGYSLIKFPLPNLNFGDAYIVPKSLNIYADHQLVRKIPIIIRGGGGSMGSPNGGGGNHFNHMDNMVENFNHFDGSVNMVDGDHITGVSKMVVPLLKQGQATPEVVEEPKPFDKYVISDLFKPAKEEGKEAILPATYSSSESIDGSDVGDVWADARFGVQFTSDINDRGDTGAQYDNVPGDTWDNAQTNVYGGNHMAQDPIVMENKEVKQKVHNPELRKLYRILLEQNGRNRASGGTFGSTADEVSRLDGDGRGNNPFDMPLWADIDGDGDADTRTDLPDGVNASELSDQEWMDLYAGLDEKRKIESLNYQQAARSAGNRAKRWVLKSIAGQNEPTLLDRRIADIANSENSHANLAMIYTSGALLDKEYGRKILGVPNVEMSSDEGRRVTTKSAQNSALDELKAWRASAMKSYNKAMRFETIHLPEAVSSAIRDSLKMMVSAMGVSAPSSNKAIGEDDSARYKSVVGGVFAAAKVFYEAQNDV